MGEMIYYSKSVCSRQTKIHVKGGNGGLERLVEKSWNKGKVIVGELLKERG